MTMAASRQASIDMYFDTRLWQLTAGLRMRMAGGIFLGLLALAAGIARYVFLGQLLARVFDAAPVKDWIAPAACAGAMVLLRALFDHLRTVQANRSSADVQQALRARLYDRIVALGPAWFANQRTGGVMLTVVDGVEQLQTFFGQYLPQPSPSSRSSPSGTSRRHLCSWPPRCSRCSARWPCTCWIAAPAWRAPGP